MGKTNIVIADICSVNKNGKSSGHYFPVAQNYFDILQGSDNIYIAGGPIYHSHFGSHHLDLPYDLKPECNIIIKKLHELQNCRILFKKTKGDIVILQSVAQITTYIAILLFYKNDSNLYLIQYYTESINSLWKRILWKYIKRKIKGIICSSDKVGLSFGIPYLVVTDYIYSKQNNQMHIPFKERKYDFCLIGVIHKDKGQVEALKHLANKGLKIVIAGKVADSSLYQELTTISKQDPTIEMQLGYVSDADYYRYIRNSKYCILNYRGTYNDRSSGVVLDIIFNNTPVVGNKCGALSFVEEESLGYIYEDISKMDFTSLLDSTKYEKLQINIDKYLDRQKNYINNLRNFLIR